jgi:hypothetical protein
VKKVYISLVFIAVFLLTFVAYAYTYNAINVAVTVTDPITISPHSLTVSSAYPDEHIPFTLTIENSGTTGVILTFNGTITVGPGGANSTVDQHDFSYVFPQPYVALPGVSTMTMYIIVGNGAPPGKYTILIFPQRVN